MPQEHSSTHTASSTSAPSITAPSITALRTQPQSPQLQTIQPTKQSQPQTPQFYTPPQISQLYTYSPKHHRSRHAAPSTITPHRQPQTPQVYGHAVPSTKTTQRALNTTAQNITALHTQPQYDHSCKQTPQLYTDSPKHHSHTTIQPPARTPPDILLISSGYQSLTSPSALGATTGSLRPCLCFRARLSLLVSP